MTKIGFSKFIALLVHLTALVTVLSYSFYHLFFDHVFIGYLSLISGIILIVSTIRLALNIENDLFEQIFILSMTLTLIATCYFLGIRGAILVFPLISAFFYSFAYRYALILSISAALLCMISSLNSLEIVTVVRLSVGLGLTIFFNASFASLVNKQNAILKTESREDYLTGILNRRGFFSWITRVLPQAIADGKIIALLYIDLDDFKRINDNYGHAIGDKVLKETGNRMQKLVRPGDVFLHLDDSFNIARLAGDEFALVITNGSDISDIEKIVLRLLESLGQSYVFDDLTLNINASIGISIAGSEANDAESLLANADAALYRAKEGGKKCYKFFNDNIAYEINLSKKIEYGIQDALTKDDFYLVYMPIYSCNDLTVVGVEVLIRCNSHYLDGIGPDQYIPIAEKCGLIYDIDLWVIEETLKKIAFLQKSVLNEHFIFCINLSTKELLSHDIVEKLRLLLLKYQVAPKSIEIEITETSLVDSTSKSIDILTKLKNLGIKLSLDDFGTGYTAFNQLSDYPVDTLKIDRSFVANIGKSDNTKRPMVDIIVSIARLYELIIVAEGVETEAQFNYLKEMGCHYSQGNYLSKPLKWEDFINFINSQ